MCYVFFFALVFFNSLDIIFGWNCHGIFILDDRFAYLLMLFLYKFRENKPV